MPANLNAPGFAPDLTSELQELWTAHVRGIFETRIKEHEKNARTTSFCVNPVTSSQFSGKPNPVPWDAYPAQQIDEAVRAVDANRDVQDEYCEWSVRRDDAGKVIRVTVTTETPDYFEFLYPEAKERVLAIYQEHVSPDVEQSQLESSPDVYDRHNRWNHPAIADGNLMHMVQGSNNLDAAITLAIAAARPAVDEDDRQITEKIPLIDCLGFGERGRNSDPHIGKSVNDLVLQGKVVTFADPPGLYIEAPPGFSDFETPDGSPIEDWYTVTRGSAELPVRMVFSAPPGSPFTLEDLKVERKPVTTGGQIVKHLRVQLFVQAAKADAPLPKAKECGPA